MKLSLALAANSALATLERRWLVPVRAFNCGTSTAYLQSVLMLSAGRALRTRVRSKAKTAVTAVSSAAGAEGRSNPKLPGTWAPMSTGAKAAPRNISPPSTVGSGQKHAAAQPAVRTAVGQPVASKAEPSV